MRRGRGGITNRFRLTAITTLLTTFACTTWQSATEPADVLIPRDEPSRVRFEMRDGSEIELRDPQVIGDTVVGDDGESRVPLWAVVATEVEVSDGWTVVAISDGGDWGSIRRRGPLFLGLSQCWLRVGAILRVPQAPPFGRHGASSAHPSRNPVVGPPRLFVRHRLPDLQRARRIRAPWRIPA